MTSQRLMCRLVALLGIGVCVLGVPALAQDCPELVGRWGYGPTYAVAVSGDFAYVASGVSLLVVDISNPAAPVVLAEKVGLPGAARDVAVAGAYAYVAGAGSGLRVIDVSTPSNPVEVASVDMSGTGYAIGVAVDGAYAYVAGGNSGLRVINISDPTAPFEIGFYDTPFYADGVTVAGDYAYVADGESGLRIVNILDPAVPVEVGFLDTPAYADGVVVVDDYAYVADGDSGLLVVDVSTPESPVQAGFLDLPGFSEDIAVVDDLAYVADDYSGLRVISVSNSAAPVEVGSVATPNRARGIAVAGSFAFVAGYSSGLRVIDVTSPFAPVEIGSVDGSSPARSVAVAGSYAYVADGGVGLYVVDITNPPTPSEVGFVAKPGYAYGVAVTGDYAYVADYIAGLRVVDVSNPAAPVEVGFVAMPGAYDVAIADPYVYVAAAGGGLQVIDVSDPTTPVQVGFCDTPHYADDVAVVGSRAYVADRNSGLRVIDISDPEAPIEIGAYDTPGRAYGVAVTGDYAYIADYTAGLRVINVSDPEAPFEVGYFDSSTGAYDVAVVGSYAYLADIYFGLRVINISNPAAPIEIGSYDTPGTPYGIAVAEGLVYVADLYASVEIFQECGGNSPPAVWPIEDQTVEEGATLSFTVVAVDPDPDPVTYSASNLPPGATLDPLSGGFSHTPDYDVSTSEADTWFDVVFAASDGRGGIGTATVRITVTDVTGGTPPGDNVEVTPADPDSGEPIEYLDVEFSSVDTGGVTTASTTTEGAPPPTGFRLGDNIYTEIETTAAFDPPIHLCFDYSSFGIPEDREDELALFHLAPFGGLLIDGSTCTQPEGCWEDITDPDDSPDYPNPDTINDIICGTADSVSPFAVVEAIQITAPIDPIAVNTVITASLDLGDVDAVDEAIWTWGDGTQSAAILSNGIVEGTHSYSSAGIYIPHLTLWKSNLEVGSADFKYIVVYDPDGGFVTGGGWITSPPGAYPADPTVTGKANFGFVAKYVRGAQVPTGTTEFRFNAAGLNFQSSSYQWLVVAGAKAKFKGEGVINGGGSYGFMLSATDGALPGGGGSDKFRIKIWDKATDVVVYDNQLGAPDDADPTTVIGGGSIVIHK